MGDRQSVAILKTGDWVLVEGRVGRVDCFGASNKQWVFVVIDEETHTFEPQYVIPLPKELNPILSDSISIKEDV